MFTRAAGKSGKARIPDRRQEALKEKYLFCFYVINIGHAVCSRSL